MGNLAIRVGGDAQNRFYLCIFPVMPTQTAIQEATQETTHEATQATKNETIPEAATHTFAKTSDNNIPPGVPPVHGRLFEIIGCQASL